MDWSEERYVRVYTRDTVEWAALSWQARAVWLELLRKFDRTGAIALGRLGRKGLAGLLRIPLEVLSAGLDGDDGLLADGCLQEHADYVIAPNFLEAQEARTRPMPDAERQRNRRERLRVKLSETQRSSHAASRSVTAVTKSHDVTPEPSLAVPSLTKPKEDLSANPTAPSPEDQLIAKWNTSAAPEMPRCQQFTDSRRKKATHLLGVVPLESWDTLIAMANGSDFCRGRTERGWRLSLTKMLDSPELALKVIEGNYVNGTGPPAKGARSQSFVDDRPPPPKKLTDSELEDLMQKARSQ